MAGSFKVIKMSKSSAQFVIEDIDLAVVNAVRRIILAEVPNVGFAFDPNEEENGITIHANTCALHNEFLSHRLSLIPLCFDEEEVETFEPGKYRFVLRKKNTGQDAMPVTSNDFEIYDEDNVRYESKLKNKVFPADPITKDHILITKLKPNLYDAAKGEEIDIECVATVNIAKEHARWSPVSKCTFFNVVDEKAAKEAEKYVPEGELNRFMTLERQRFFKKNKYDEPCAFEFHIDSECRLSPSYLFQKALSILRNQVEDFAKKIDTYDVVTMNGMHTISVTNYSHTLCNVIQSLIYNRNFRDKKPADNTLEFIGYHQSHPLDNKMLLKIKFKEVGASLQEFIRDECAAITSYIENVEAMWNAV